ncbi:MAG: hypothetical protein PHC53_05215 [Patescibacteria group bacterium]|nr:hypothetical protein [Patescibacteria group bacterium]
MRNFLKNWWFGLLLSACLIVFEILIALVPILSTPPGYRWLGAGIFNTGDMAVYLNYLGQLKNSWLISNLYNNFPQALRFDTFWSLGGILVKVGASPLWAHEILRWLSIIALAFSVYAAAKAMTRTEKQARLTTLLVVSGLSTGWLHSIWMGATHQWTPLSLAAPDLDTELAIAPLLIGGAHMILSLALQITALRWLWEAIREEKIYRLLPACLCLFALSSFHPYFTPLFGIVSVMAIWPRLKAKLWHKPLLSFLGVNLSLVPWTAYYVWLMAKDPNFKTHHLQTNFLPLDPWYFWIIIILPFLLAAYWILKNKIPENFLWREKPKWVLAWIAAAIICMLLPFPWTRKFTQGLVPALVLLTLPFWLMLAGKLFTKKILWPLKACLAILITFPYIHLLQTQITMAVDPYWSKNFYRPIALFQAWDFIQRTAPKNSLVLATDLWSNYWTPAYTLRTVWIGHNHETPDFKSRVAPYLDWTKTQDERIFRGYLNQVPVTQVIATTPSDVQRLKTLMDQNKWLLSFQNDSAAVWQRK